MSRCSFCEAPATSTVSPATAPATEVPYCLEHRDDAWDAAADLDGAVQA